MQIARGHIGICAQGTVVGILGVCGKQNLFGISPLPHCHNDRRMLKGDAVKGQLHDVTGLQRIDLLLLCDRTDGTLRAREELIEIRNARLCGCFPVGVKIIPAECRRVVHNTAAGIDAL